MGTRSIKSLSWSTFKVASAAAQFTGWPPKVVMCPKTGSCVNKFIFSLEETIAPIGMPPPSAFPRVRISGTILKCSTAKSFPVLPIPHCISSKINWAPTSSQRLRNAFMNSCEGTRTPASPCIVSMITPAVLSVMCFKSSTALKLMKRLCRSTCLTLAC